MGGGDCNHQLLTSINSAWQKMWTEVCYDSTGFEVEEATTRASSNQAGLDEVGVNNVEELLASYGKSLTSEEL